MEIIFLDAILKWLGVYSLNWRTMSRGRVLCFVLLPWLAVAWVNVPLDASLARQNTTRTDRMARKISCP